MELHEFTPPDFGRMVARGEITRVWRKPRTVQEVLDEARAEAALEDEVERYRADPVGYIEAHRPRTLLERLLGL